MRSWYVSFFIKLAQGQKCVEPTKTPYDMYIPSLQKTITVPPVSSETSDFSYATENAVVALPASCATQRPIDGVEIEDGKRKGMYLFRRHGSGWDLNDLMRYSSSSKGLVIVLPGHRGSIGTGATQMYLRILSGLGFVVVALDGGADRLGMKGERLKTLKGQNGGSADVEFYSETCVDFAKPFCYTTKKDNIVSNPEDYKQYMERVHLIRRRELEYFIEAALVRGADGKSLLEAFHVAGKRIFLLGRSDGGVAVSQYFHERLYSDFLDGIIIAAFSCDFTYMNSCAEHAKVCQDSCKKTTPLLNWISDVDPYFSRTNGSMAVTVANSTNGYGGEITGNCQASFEKQHLTRATTVLLDGSAHDESAMYNELIRRLLSDFTSSPGSPLGSLSDCTGDANLYRCKAAGTIKAEKTLLDSKSMPSLTESTRAIVKAEKILLDSKSMPSMTDSTRASVQVLPRGSSAPSAEAHMLKASKRKPRQSRMHQSL